MTNVKNSDAWKQVKNRIWKFLLPREMAPDVEWDRTGASHGLHRNLSI